MRWIRRLIRKYTKPMHEYDAMQWKQRLSFVYMIAAWNTMGIVAYYIYTGRNDWAYYYGLKTEEQKAERPGVYYADLLGKKNVKILRIEGFQITDEFEYAGQDDQKPL